MLYWCVYISIWCVAYAFGEIHTLKKWFSIFLSVRYFELMRIDFCECFSHFGFSLSSSSSFILHISVFQPQSKQTVTEVFIIGQLLLYSFFFLFHTYMRHIYIHSSFSIHLVFGLCRLIFTERDSFFCICLFVCFVAATYAKCNI